MSIDISGLQAFDSDGALREAADRVGHSTRATFLRRSGAVVGAGLLAGGLPSVARAQGGLPKVDVDILNYALTLEYLETAFYEKALSDGALRGEYKRFASVVAEHEQAHVDAIKKTLGSKAGKRPSFDFKGTTADQATFAQTAIVLEDTGVEAYQGQAGNIKTPAVLKAAISIHPVEARHAAWIRSIVGDGNDPSPAPAAFNPAKDMDQVLAAVTATGFISSMRGAEAGSAVSAQPTMTG